MLFSCWASVADPKTQCCFDVGPASKTNIKTTLVPTSLAAGNTLARRWPGVTPTRGIRWKHCHFPTIRGVIAIVTGYLEGDPEFRGSHSFLGEAHFDGFPRGDEAELMRPFGMCHPGRPNTLTQCWGNARPTVCDAGPPLAQHWVNVLCLLGTRETLCWPTRQDVHPMLV